MLDVEFEAFALGGLSAGHVANVEEDIFVGGVGFEETEASFLVEPDYRSLRHNPA